MLAETKVPELTEEVLASMDKDKVIDLLAIKTEHLLVASRCHLAENALNLIRGEVQMIQAEMKRREND